MVILRNGFSNGPGQSRQFFRARSFPTRKFRKVASEFPINQLTLTLLFVDIPYVKIILPCSYRLDFLFRKNNWHLLGYRSFGCSHSGRYLNVAKRARARLWGLKIGVLVFARCLTENYCVRCRFCAIRNNFVRSAFDPSKDWGFFRMCSELAFLSR